MYVFVKTFYYLFLQNMNISFVLKNTKTICKLVEDNYRFELSTAQVNSNLTEITYNFFVVFFFFF